MNTLNGTPKIAIKRKEMKREKKNPYRTFFFFSKTFSYLLALRFQQKIQQKPETKKKKKQRENRSNEQWQSWRRKVIRRVTKREEKIQTLSENFDFGTNKISREAFFLLSAFGIFVSYWLMMFSRTNYLIMRKETKERESFDSDLFKCSVICIVLSTLYREAILIKLRFCHLFFIFWAY